MEFKDLSRKRGSIKSKITQFKKYVNALMNTINSSSSFEYSHSDFLSLDMKTNHAVAVLTDFEKTQEEIERIVPGNELDVQYEERETFTNAYFEVIVLAKKLIELYKTNLNINNSNSDVNDITSSAGLHVADNSAVSGNINVAAVKLPTISLPKFNGKYELWLEFRDTFQSLIHENNSLNSVQKFHYLKACLEGKAAEVVQSLTVSSSNYEIAWKTILDRFNNSNLLIQGHVKALFNLESISKESSSGLRTLIDNITKNLRSLQSLNEPTEHWCTLLIFLAVNKLDSNTTQEWERVKPTACKPTLEDLLSFLRKRSDILETIEFNRSTSIKTPPAFNQTKHNKPANQSRSFAIVTPRQCSICNQSHALYNCDEFKGLSVEERFKRTKELRLCINCLNPGHFSKSCKYGSCKQCGSKHNTLLHSGDTKGNKSQIPDTVADSNIVLAVTRNVHTKQILLPTALLHVLDAHGNAIVCRVLLDSGSQSNFITESLSNSLGISKSKVSVNILGINQISSNATYKCKVKLRSRIGSYEGIVSCIVLPQITDKLPAVEFENSQLVLPKDIQLADPNFGKPGKIDILLGAELFWYLINDKQIRLGKYNPILQHTKLGWVVSGAVLTNSTSKRVNCNLITNEDISNQLQKFWEIENPLTENPLSTNDRECELYFKDTLKRSEEGRFIVSLPFKASVEKLGNSKEVALRRFYNLERRLQSDVQLRQRYLEFMKEYRELGHMSRVTNPDAASITYYLPHHGVLRESSITTKLRVVFDGSSRSETGVSINDIQHVGPPIQGDLLAIILRFRQHSYVVSADIMKMYRQVLINESQRDLQRIYWRDDPTKQLEVYRLNTVTYGTTAAPYLAIRCLRQLAIENKELYPHVAEVIERDFYVDDLLTGGESIAQLNNLSRDIIWVLKSACFELRKWTSNDNRVLNGIQETLLQCNMVHLGENSSDKTLGVLWSCSSDTLHYKMSPSLNNGRKETKRSILSTIAHIFDPLGLLAPCIMIAKIILQRLWTAKLDWDDQLPEEICLNWQRFKEELPLLEKIHIRRRVICEAPVLVELHGFCDASEHAYGACVYIRSSDRQGITYVNLICAKGKVAPIKGLTVPRLELCGAVLLSKLIKRVKESLTIHFPHTYLWTDSMVVLGWIRTDLNLLKTFVGHRIGEIHEFTNVSDWFHVSTKENPADFISRGAYPKNLKSTRLWWSGPDWLQQSQSMWPMSATEPKIEDSDLPELKTTTVLVCNEGQSFFSNYSSISQLQRLVALCRRFYQNCKVKRDERIIGSIKIPELNEAMVTIVKCVQAEAFPSEIRNLRTDKPVSSKSRLLSLTPFLDRQGLVRVGGRLGNADIAYNKRHPILLPDKNHITKLIFRDEHVKLLHAGPQMLLYSVRQNYWPIRGRNLARQTVRDCMKCFRFSPKPFVPFMGNLPKDRVSQCTVFNVVGVDYAGPMLIKNKVGRGGQNTKCYICLFICFAVKAVHIELVSCLTTEAFLAALRRFTSRRGKPLRIFSDNGTTFVGANVRLNEMSKFLNKHKHMISDHLAREGIEWQFIPARSPHFGGLWEAGIKSMKNHLYKIAGNTALTFEELTTLLIQVEGILNSRPLSSLSTDPNDILPLTPAHFLIGKSLLDVPERDYTDLKDNSLSRFERIQKMKQHFWSRWSMEYISGLIKRTKWQRPQQPLCVGTLVIIQEENVPVMNWRLGRVVQIHPGVDGVTRVASVKTVKGVVKRAVVKLCPLPLGTEIDQFVV